MRKLLILLISLISLICVICGLVISCSIFAPQGQAEDKPLQDKPEIFVQLGHSQGVSSVAFSPDGKYVLSGSHDKSLRLWEVATGKEVRQFQGHSGPVNSVAFSPDGRYALSGSRDMSLRLWEVTTGKEIRTFQGHSLAVFSVAFSPDGKYALSGSADKSLRLWEVATGKEVRQFQGHSAWVNSVTFSPDGKYVLSGSEDNSLRLWEVATGKEIRTVQGHSKKVTSVTFSPDGKYALSGSWDKTLKLWEVATGKEVRQFQGHSEEVSSVAFSPDGKYALSGSFDKSLKLWEVATGKEIRTFHGHSSFVWSVAFSPDGKYALSDTKLWDVTTGNEVRQFQGYSKYITSVAFSPDGKYTLSGSGNFDHSLRLWEVTTGKEIRAFQGHSKEVTSVVFSPDGKYALSGSSDNSLKLWDVATGKEIRTFQGHSDEVWSVAFSPGGEYALSGSSDNSLKLWDIATGKELRQFQGHSQLVWSVAFSPDGKYALSGSGDKSLKLWDIATGKEIKTFQGHSGSVSSVAFSPDGKYALSSGGFDNSLRCDNSLRLWEVATGKEIRVFQGYYGAVSRVTFSPDGKYVLSSGDFDNIIGLLEVTTGKEIRIFQGHSGGVMSVAFSPDNKYVLSGSYDGTIRLWNIETGKEIVQMVSFTDGEWICITPEGYFNSSKDGAKYLNVRIGNNVYSIDNFFERFYNPAVVAQVLSGKKIELTDNLQKGFKTPPEVTIISPKPGEAFDKEEIEVIVQAKDTGGGITEIRLYHNGSAIGEDRRGIAIVEKKPSIVKKSYRVSLIEGENIFRAVGFSRDRTESNPYELVVKLSAPAKEVTLHMVVVGINQYKNSALNLNFAELDARAVKDFFNQKGKRLFKDVKMVELYNDSATKENILAKLGNLSHTGSREGQTQPQDVVIIYLAGHGMNLEDNWYFIPYDVTYPERDEEVKTKGISSVELTEKIKNITALKKLVLIDACKSGTVLLAFARGLEERRALAQLGRATGTHIIAASTTEQSASEVKDLGHGVFTYTLLEGLGGKAKMIENRITVRGLLTYVEERLPEISKKYRAEAQYPVSDSRGMDFPLVIGE